MNEQRDASTLALASERWGQVHEAESTMLLLRFGEWWFSWEM